MIQCQSPDLTAPDGSVIAVIEEGSTRLTATGVSRLAAEAPLPAAAGNYVLEFPLGRASRVERTAAVSALLRLRDAGSTFVILTHDEALVESCADEVWWTREGILIGRGDPGEILGTYRAHCATLLRALGSGQRAEFAPRLRAGDGRAMLESLELRGEAGKPTVVFRSGEEMTVAVTVCFAAEVAAPVVGILLRCRIGLNVYGTNTELEGIGLGPVQAGQRIRVEYRYRCELCPGDYTVTAASHDPDGVWHDWAEDAVAFAVTDGRYTAGVANLRGSVTFEKIV